ncbi:MAG: carbohydrate kinase, yjef related protein, partial [uncultured bacterium]
AISEGGNENIVITPHKGEFERFFHAEDVAKIAKKYSINILLKGLTDTIASSNGEISLNKTGNAGMTVGGSGDVLAGVCGGLMAQGLSPFSAAQSGAFLLGKAGDNLKMRKDFCYTAKDLAEEIPYTMGDSGRL